MNILGIIANEMRIIGVPYEFMRWSGKVQYPYFIGEYSETITDSEDGYKESTMIITGTARDSWLELEQYRAKIEEHFPNVYGFRSTTDKGSAVIFYGNSFPIDTGEADLKRIQINLQIKEWRAY